MQHHIFASGYAAVTASIAAPTPAQPIGATLRLTRLHIQNFRAIENFAIENLTDFIVIAGPNGCGKSCVLDGIRPLKSVYGGYQSNEWMQWFGEFQIELNDRRQMTRVLRDPNLPMRVAASIELASTEVDYLDENAERVLEPLVWAEVTSQPLENFGYSSLALATQFRQFGAEVAETTRSRAVDLRSSLANPVFDLSLTVDPAAGLTISPNPTMEVVFKTFDPENLGIVDYHGATRNYQREQIGGVNLNIDGLQNQRRQQSLYNSAGKYSNVKTELATTYVRDLIAKQANGSPGTADLNDTLKELFQTFFPDKEYLGVQAEASGGLAFPVRVKSGQVHDINELSSGEKEVVYGYLRLRNATPRNSTILLDEPELHLNPGLLEGFPDFYNRNLGVALGNQLWLVTHSDTLLRQAVGNRSYTVVHMTSAATEDPLPNQALPVVRDDDLERATIALVGDLATYRPHGKVLLFEGGGNTEFDTWLTGRLFPDLLRSMNLVSGGGKRRVNDLYEVLTTTAEEVGLTRRFFVITDKDTAVYEAAPAGTRQIQWDRYHIENYLLEPLYIRRAISAVMQRPKLESDYAVTGALADAAASILPSLVQERVRKIVNDRIVGAINIGGRPNGTDPMIGLVPSVVGSFERLDSLRSEVTDEASLRAIASKVEDELRSWLSDGRWIQEFPGRRILQTFVRDHLEGAADYEAFRNVIVDKMTDESFQPSGMSAVLAMVTDD